MQNTLLIFINKKERSKKGRGTKLKMAIQKCTQLGGDSKLFRPSSPAEVKEIKTLANKKSFGLDYNRMFVWINYKLESTTSRKFPPDLVSLKGDKSAPDSFHEPAASRLYNRKISK